MIEYRPISLIGEYSASISFNKDIIKVTTKCPFDGAISYRENIIRVVSVFSPVDHGYDKGIHGSPLVVAVTQVIYVWDTPEKQSLTILLSVSLSIGYDKQKVTNFHSAQSILRCCWY